MKRHKVTDAQIYKLEKEFPILMTNVKLPKVNDSKNRYKIQQIIDTLKKPSTDGL